MASRGCRDRQALSLFTLAAGVITFGFFSLHPALGSSGLYALYSGPAS
jgi:hypothetical protein